MGPEFFGVGFGEAVLVAVIALIVVGPQHFPEIARQAGRWYRVLRRYTATITADMKGALDELESEIEAEGQGSLRSLREVGEQFGRDLEGTRPTGPVLRPAGDAAVVAAASADDAATALRAPRELESVSPSNPSNARGPAPRA